MAGPLDHQLGIGLESAYGTPVTPTRFYEWDIDGSEHSYDPKRIQGSGMQVGDGGIARADRSVSVVGQSSLTIAMDAQSRGLGMLLKAALGAGVSTLVAGTTYQQLFTTGLTGALLDSLTAQLGIVRSDAAGTVDAYTYPGCSVMSLEIGCSAGDVVKVKAELDALTPATGTALATASYPALVAPYHFGQGAVTIGGSVTVPTATALATGGTAAPNVREATMTLDNALNVERWRFGGRNQPRAAKRSPKLKLTAENDGTALRDALLGHTTLPVTITWTSTEALSTGFATLQIVAPACKIPSGSFPQPSEDPVYDLELDVLKPASGQALYVVLRTADTAL